MDGTGPLGAGVRMMPWTVMLFLVAPVAGGLINRVGERPLLMIGLAGQAIGFGLLALLATPGRPYWQLILPLVIAGSGVSTAMPAAQNATIAAVPGEAIGSASGTFNTLRQLGAGAELLADLLDWLDARLPAGLDAAAGRARDLAAGAKALQFRVARLVARGRTDACEDLFDSLVTDEAAVFERIERCLG